MWISSGHEFKETLRCLARNNGIDISELDDLGAANPLIAEAFEGVSVARDVLRDAEDALGRKAAPVRFICPISQQLMLCPVIAPDGYHYEGWHLSVWLNANPEHGSPVTNERLDPSQCRVDLTLQKEICAFIYDTSYSVRM